LGPELSIPDAMFMQHFVHGLCIESAKYLDMPSGGVFVHCTIEEGKLILDRILLITPLEYLQLKAPHISEEEPIIPYPEASEVSTSPARELLQLTALEKTSNKEEDDLTQFPLSMKKIASNMTFETCQRLPPVTRRVYFLSMLDNIGRNSWFLKKTSYDSPL
jgi:hypothetical protein